MNRRRLFTILAAMSVLLFVATVTGWVRSYRTSDLLSVDYPGHRAGVIFSQGSMLLELDGWSRAHWHLRG